MDSSAFDRSLDFEVMWWTTYQHGRIRRNYGTMHVGNYSTDMAQFEPLCKIYWRMLELLDI
eukprot:scaffold15316_cov14-Prasinocladus_malaysianus.AAC.1